MSSTTNPASAQNLLNLLNFSSQRDASPAQSIQPEPRSESRKLSGQESTQHRSISASDLVARLMSPSSESRTNTTQNAQGNETVQGVNPLLELLNRQTSTNLAARAKQDAGQTIDLTEGRSSVERTSSPMRIFGSAASRETTPFEAPKSPSPEESHKPIFTYTNPFEALKASRPHTPKTLTPDEIAMRFKEPSQAQKSSTKSPNPTLEEEDRISANSDDNSTSKPFAAQKSDVNLVQPGLSKEDNDPHQDTSFPIKPEEPVPNIDAVQSAAEYEPQSQTMQERALDDPTKERQARSMSGEWEDVHTPPAKDEPTRVVPVLTFPVKAFVSITLQLDKQATNGIRDDGVIEISRIKKDFDQIDRSLAAATSKYITYAFVKHGGLRIIRQDDGKDRHVFKYTQDRIFNVSICTSALSGPPSDHQAVLGTGVSGAVYYATISKDDNDLFERNQLDVESLIFPAFPHSDENTAGGMLKTRARRSSRHPEFFAIGRGKFINLIWPATAMSSRYGITETHRQVDIETLLQERALQISTGKAGKDFVFSEDDTMIVSLDKTGRLRFWDIRKLVEDANATAEHMTPISVDTPVLSLMTASPAEKSWPTSVLFVDKARPYIKSGALRYVLVGLRQNHTLQLWDIALGKAVQEINFPHENEVDGICSVNYHPATGIVVVGHPTRNSLFFIHLSTPRYTLSSTLTQAAYVQRVAAKDPAVPKPDSTVCMSGVRELSFSGRGQLRSVELLSVQNSLDKSKTPDEGQTLFELYVVHSKGVTCLAINKQDLGWTNEKDAILSIDAEKEGLVSITGLKLGSIIEETAGDKSPVKDASQPSQISKSSKRKSKRSKDPSDEVVNGIDENQVFTSIEVGGGLQETMIPQIQTQIADVTPSKESRRNKKKPSQGISSQVTDQTVQVSTQNEDLPPIGIGSNTSQAVNGRDLPSTTVNREPNSKPEALSLGISGDWLDKELKKVERGVSAEFKKEFDILYENIQRDRASLDQSSASRQEAVLRLVSSSLNNNVEKSLSRILADQMREIVVPSVIQSVAAQLGDGISKSLSRIIPTEVGIALPNAINTVLDTKQFNKTMADSLLTKLGPLCQRQVTIAVNEALGPALRDLVTTATSTAVAATESRLLTQIHSLQLQNEVNRDKIDQMNLGLEGLANTIRAMSETQVSFQNQILKERRQQTLSRDPPSTMPSRQSSSARFSTSPAVGTKVSTTRVRSKAELEFNEVSSLMEQRKYEEGSIKWLQSSQPVKLFDDLFVNFTPEYLSTDVSPLVAFSIAVTVANALETNIDRRLEWISAAFDAVDFQDHEIIELSEHAPQLVGSMIQKLESLYMSLAERDNQNPVLQAIPSVAKKARDLKATFQQVHDRNRGRS